MITFNKPNTNNTQSISSNIPSNIPSGINTNSPIKVINSRNVKSEIEKKSITLEDAQTEYNTKFYVILGICLIILILLIAVVVVLTTVLRAVTFFVVFVCANE